ncbi:hypothetical protein DSO57_1026136 [Entomophthora muscae]|uniref:Uncharacterized protein n=2 Tax=Entomophthora muscae TaxID=34485 RepID=A0ACC2SR12_9FUNG|nr:hypothetical protein DSO57_1018612 [Entomophthora muscae]KAJ9064839.1 hypothetical protein DSO57_1026136 [Entomophthora muscae]
MKLSGLQKEVLGLYRSVLRAIRLKPEANQPRFIKFARGEFEKNTREIKAKDFQSIEFLLRKGRRQLEIYQSSSITNIHV